MNLYEDFPRKEARLANAVLKLSQELVTMRTERTQKAELARALRKDVYNLSKNIEAKNVEIENTLLRNYEKSKKNGAKEWRAT